jgi:hypothetical protein
MSAATACTGLVGRSAREPLLRRLVQQPAPADRGVQALPLIGADGPLRASGTDVPGLQEIDPGQGDAGDLRLRAQWNNIGVYSWTKRVQAVCWSGCRKRSS